MRILVVNDDGIKADGIRHLTKIAAELGDVWVVAPDQQCSAMSHRITVHGSIDVHQEEFPVGGVHAFRVGGTPADCVKIGIKYLMPQKPDLIMSGINHGYNVGMDVLYSGTVGAAMEALINGIPAIAFSKEMNDNYEVADSHLLTIIRDLMGRTIQKNEIWNVNIPGCPLTMLKGVLENRILAQYPFFLDHYERTDIENGGFRLSACGIWNTDAVEGTDMHAVMDRYISIGKVSNNVLQV